MLNSSHNLSLVKDRLARLALKESNSLTYTYKLLLVGIVYFCAGRLGLAIPYHDTHVSLIWLPTGIAVAALFRWEMIFWPAIFVAALLVNMVSGSSLLLSSAIAIGNTIGPIVVAILLKKNYFDPCFRNSKDVILFVFASVIGMLIPASVGIVCLYLGGHLALNNLVQTWTYWWMGDVVGIFLAAPLLIAISRQTLVELFERRFEISIFTFVLLATNWFIFLLPNNHFSLAFVSESLLIWAAMRFGITGASLSVLISIGIATLGTVSGRGPFFSGPQSLLVLWAYMTTLTMVTLVTTALQSASKRSADKLRDSEERLQLALQGSSDAPWDWNLERNEMYCSPRWWQMLGYESSELKATAATWRRLAHPEDMERIEQAYRNAMLHGPDVIEQQLRLQHKDGSYVWVLSRGIILRDASGKAIRACGTHTDLTARKRLEAQSETERSMLERLAKGEALPILLNHLALSYEMMFPEMLCSILLLDESGRHLRHCAAPSLPRAYCEFIDGSAIGPAAGSCGTAAYSGKFVMVDDIANDPLWVDYKDIALTNGLRACWSMPILSTQGRVFGTFALYYRTPRSLVDDELEAIRRGAHLCSLAIERRRSEDALQLASMVYQHSTEAMVVSDANDRIIAINPAFTKMTGYTIDAVTGKKTTQFGSRRENREIHQAIRQALRAHSTWQGELWNQRKNGEEFAERITINTIRNDDGSIHRHVYLFSDITDKKRADELILQQANYDLLTGLPNRSLFRDQLDFQLNTAARLQLTVALLFIDLDLFKEVNDTLGHDVGDTLLIEAARRIKECVRESDSVARLGGDEFTVTLTAPNESNHESSDVAQISQKILAKLAEPFQLKNEVVYLSASIGITLFPADGREPETLLKNADQAMYVAKSEGRNRYSFFTRSMQEQADTRLRLSNDLRGALAANQLEVFFQPIIDMADGSIFKAEALLRWRHPQRGMVSPAIFIPIAEDSGLISEIGDWVFKQSAMWAQRWSGLLGRHFQISVNKSPVQFSAQDRYPAWSEYLQELGLPGACIAVEITEGLLLHAAPTVNQQLQQLRDNGIQISIDDFGTGYSSMAYLKKFSIDYLKIDQTFVRDMTVDLGDRAIAEAIIVMAHKLGYKVIAEGIETNEQREILAEAQCDFGQGYLFAKPMPAQEFENMLVTKVTF